MPTPTLKQLEAFCWTAKLGSFQAAADRLNTTQSAISKRVADLEHLYDQQLLNRKYRRAKLTPEGERLRLSAEEVLASVNKLSFNMEKGSSFQGTLRIGASELVALTWLPTLVQRIKQEYPAIVINLNIEAGGRVLERLKSGTVDLAFVAGPMWGKQFASEKLASVEFAWMASPSLKIPRRAITPEEMASYPMLVHSPEGVATRLYALWLQKAGGTTHHALSANTLNVMARLTIGGLGISCLPTQFFAEQLKKRQLVRVKTEPTLPKLDFFAVYRREELYELTDKVITIAKEVCDFRSATE